MSLGIVKTAVPCACSSTCSVVLVVDYEQYGDEAREVFVEFYESHRGRLSERLKAAWRVIRGRDPWLHAVCLQAEGVEQLRRALDGRAT